LRWQLGDVCGDPPHQALERPRRSRQNVAMWRNTGRRPTLGDLQRATPWIWVSCERCQHYAPLACAVAVIRWGPNTSSDKLRRCARCTACGNKGATIQHPGWGGNDIGFHPLRTHPYLRPGADYYWLVVIGLDPGRRRTFPSQRKAIISGFRDMTASAHRTPTQNGPSWSKRPSVS
jgi:hypothetical protein